MTTRASSVVVRHDENARCRLGATQLGVLTCGCDPAPTGSCCAAPGPATFPLPALFRHRSGAPLVGGFELFEVPDPAADQQKHSVVEAVPVALFEAMQQCDHRPAAGVHGRGW